MVIDGERKHIKEWCATYNANYEAVRMRVSRGWNPKRALIFPPCKGQKIKERSEACER